jgi:hypothetical protein
LAALEPIIVIKEGARGLGMQLRLVAGPLTDAAAAAGICATLIENKRSCETTVFDGQRLTMKAGEGPMAADASARPGSAKQALARSDAARPFIRRRSLAKHAAVEEAAPKPESSGLSSFFGRH